MEILLKNLSVTRNRTLGKNKGKNKCCANFCKIFLRPATRFSPPEVTQNRTFSRQLKQPTKRKQISWGL